MGPRSGGYYNNSNDNHRGGGGGGGRGVERDFGGGYSGQNISQRNRNSGVLGEYGNRGGPGGDDSDNVCTMSDEQAIQEFKQLVHLPNTPQSALDIQKNFDADRNTERYMRQIRHFLAMSSAKVSSAAPLFPPPAAGLGRIDAAREQGGNDRDGFTSSGPPKNAPQDTSGGSTSPVWGASGQSTGLVAMPPASPGVGVVQQDGETMENGQTRRNGGGQSGQQEGDDKMVSKRGRRERRCCWCDWGLEMLQ